MFEWRVSESEAGGQGERARNTHMENGMQRDSITTKQKGRGERKTTMEFMGKSDRETEGNQGEGKRLHDMERERGAHQSFCVLPPVLVSAFFRCVLPPVLVCCVLQWPVSAASGLGASSLGRSRIAVNKT